MATRTWEGSDLQGPSPPTRGEGPLSHHSTAAQALLAAAKMNASSLLSTLSTK